MLVIFSKLDVQHHDREWIETIRRAYDPQHALIEPHVTFVFPLDGIAISAITAHARQVARRASSISFRLTCATATRDAFGPSTHLFLLPTEGEDAMRALHARLYAGVLAPKLHPTVLFRPHVTVGAFARHEEALEAAASLGRLDIHGTLRTIHVADYDGHRLEEILQVPLG